MICKHSLKKQLVFILLVFLLGAGLFFTQRRALAVNASPNQSLVPATRKNLEQVCKIVPAGTTGGQAALRLPGLPESLFSIPFEKQIDQFWLPALLVFAIANLMWAVPFVNIVRLLQWLLSEPLLGFFRRKRRGLGVVFDSLSKRPIDLALVRLVDDRTGKIIATRVTNRLGQFSFLSQPGSYRIIAAKQKFVFPSKFLVGQSQDQNYGALSNGAPFEHKTAGTIELNVPMDAPEDRLSIKAALRRQARRFFQVLFAYGGILLSAASLVLLWNVPALIFFVVHSVLFLVFFRLVDTYYGRPWGRVARADNKKEIRQAVVRIVDARFKRILETRVTDRFGLYGFLVGKNQYYLEVYKDGFDSYRGIPFIIKNNPGLVGQDIDLERLSSPQVKPGLNVLT